MSNRILFVSNVPSPYSVEYLNELGKLADVTAVFERGFSSERDESWKNINAAHFHCVILRGIHAAVDSAFSPSVLKYINQFKADDIIIGNPATPTGIIAILYCKTVGIPFILQSEGGIPKDGKGVKERFKTFLMRNAKLYLSGMSLKNEYFLHYGAKPEQVVQYPFTSLYEKDLIKKVPTCEEKKALREKLDIQADCMILYVGQFIHRKAVDVLLKACKDLPGNPYVLCVGGSPTKEYLSIIEELGLEHVYFMQFMDRDQLSKYYLAADFFVLPTREDTWGLVVNEAMAVGLPVITTTNCVAGCELVENGINGFLIEPEDVEDLHRKMSELIMNPDLRSSMGNNSLNKISSYTYENMARVIFQALKKDQQDA